MRASCLRVVVGTAGKRRRCLSGRITDMAEIRYWAAAKEAAGVAGGTLPRGTLAEGLLLARAMDDDRFTTVLGRCSFVVDGDPVGVRDHTAVVVRDESLVDVLPPFAGG